MRQYKFRVWDKKMKEMTYSGKAIDEDGNIHKSVGFFFSCYCEKMDGGWCSTVEIMQFTGLKDHEGNDIYEGDLLQQYGHPNYPYWEVVYENDGFWIVSGDTKHRLTSVMGFPEGLKIKGNIYNKEKWIYRYKS